MQGTQVRRRSKDTTSRSGKESKKLKERISLSKTTEKHKEDHGETLADSLETETVNECAGNSLNQTILTHEALKRFLCPDTGRKQCSKCSSEDGYLKWNVSSFVSSRVIEAMPELERKRMIACTIGEMSLPAAICLKDKVSAGGRLSFDASDDVSELKGTISSFLSVLLVNHLDSLLPAIFGDAYLTLIGGWAHETALSCGSPTFDYIISLPAWVKNNKLCACHFQIRENCKINAASKVLSNSGEDTVHLPFETNLHKSVIINIERVFAQMALEVLMDEKNAEFKIDPERGISLNCGSDDPDFPEAKRVTLNMIWTRGRIHRFSLRILFGVPVNLDLTKLESIKIVGGDDNNVCGHLLLGLSEPIIINLGAYENQYFLSGAENSDHPLLQMTRISKFLLKVGDYLALESGEIGNVNLNVSVEAASLARQFWEKYEMYEEAFVNLNYQFRLQGLIQLLLEQATVDLVAQKCVLSTTKREKMPNTTIRLLKFILQHPSSKEEFTNLFELLLTLYNSKEEGKNISESIISRILSILT